MSGEGGVDVGQEEWVERERRSGEKSDNRTKTVTHS